MDKVKVKINFDSEKAKRKIKEMEDLVSEMNRKIEEFKECIKVETK